MDAGAHYYKTDLQVHTPRDPHWSGQRAVTEEERQQYAKDFVAACRSKGLQAVAITDHHDLVLVDYIRAAAANERQPTGEPLAAADGIVVFPGVELTLAVPCQALLVLDADFPSERLSTVLDTLGVDATDPAESQHAQPQALAFQGLPELHQRLDALSWIRGRYVVFPNVTDSGHKTLMRQGMQSRYIEMPCVGGYVDGSAATIGTGNQEKFAGRDSAWGNKRIAVIQTSDSRSATFDVLGQHATWIKWAKPTAEALRQACLAEESRIAHQEPQLPAVVITRLNVTASKFMGPVDLEFNPQYSALIGGRGTGKSTCLEYLRWALCDQPGELSKDDDFAVQMDRRERLISQTLTPFKGQVEVYFLLNDIPHMVRRYSETGDVMLKVGDGELQPASAADVRALLPIEAYSQRQLSSVGVRIGELTRFITRPIRDELAAIASKEEEAAIATRENFTQLLRHRVLSRAISRDRFAIDSLTQQTAELRTSLGGLADEERQLLGNKPTYDAAGQLVAGWVRRVEQADATLREAQDALARLQSAQVAQPAENLPERPLLTDLQDKINSAIGAAAATVRSASEVLSQQTGNGSDVAQKLADWRRKQASYEERYAAAAERSTAHRSRLDELAALETRLRELQTTLATQEEELATLGDPTPLHGHLRAAWRAVQDERSAALAEQCEQLTARSSGAIRATVVSGVDATTLSERFSAAVSGSSLRGKKIDTFAQRIASAEQPLVAWHEAMEELEMLLIDDAGEVASAHLSSALSVFTDQELERLKNKLSAERVLELSLEPIEPKPSFEYRTKELEYIDFKDASAGQQATALLGLLLGYSGPPLIIDQPEDDLDSQAILSVVEQLWRAKHRRQLIFTSHNANLVVNGDAELVVVCDYRAAGDYSAGRIKRQGAIDIPEMRNEITEVMEGGERAFRLRKEKYGF